MGHLVKDCGCCAQTPCTGADPLCDKCNCDTSNQTDFLANTYTVTVSGFPAVCGADDLNGAHTITHTGNCNWNIILPSGARMALVYGGGATPWQLDWDAPLNAASGFFNAVGTPEDCSPTNYSYAHVFCVEINSCPNLCTTVAGSVSFTVSA